MHKFAAVALVTITSLLAPALAASAGTGEAIDGGATVVRPAALAGWETTESACEGDPSGSTLFVDGPHAPPLGAGSVQFALGRNPNTVRTLRLASLRATRLAELADLGYSTHALAGDGPAVAQALLDIDLEGAGKAPTILRYDPRATGTVETAAWQEWAARHGVWTDREGVERTLDEVLATHPEAVIAAGGLSFATGCGEGWADHVSSLDAVRITAGGHEATYDFEPGVSGLSIADATVNEGDEVEITVSLSTPERRDVEVTVARAPAGTASDDDAVVPGHRLLLRAGETTTTFTLATIDDALDEDDETLHLQLTDELGAGVVDRNAVVTLLDDDDPPGARVQSTATVEGATGPGAARVTIALDTPSGRTVTVGYDTPASDLAHAATPGLDYERTAGTLSIPAGAISATFDLPIYADRLAEPDEVVTVRLAEATNAVATGGEVTIRDDDAGPASLRVADATAAEGDPLRFLVHRTGDARETVTVRALIVTGPSPSATSADYTPSAARTLTFLPDQHTVEVLVATTEDAHDEQNEMVGLYLKTPTNATITDADGVGTIVDDDGEPIAAPTSWLAIDDVLVTEAAGDTVVARVPVVRSGSLTGPASARFSTAPGSARGSADFANASGTVSFAAGASFATADISVLADTFPESPEQFTVTLSAPVGASLSDAVGTVTIADDDAGAPPTLRVDDVVVAEGDTGSSAATFTISRDGVTSEVAIVRWATVAVGGTAASAGADYTAVSGQSVTFEVGETTKQVSVAVAGDTIDESNEVFGVNLFTPVRAVIADATGVATIVDNEGTPRAAPTAHVAVRNAIPVREGQPASFDIVRRGDVSGPASVFAKPLPGTAAASADLSTVSQTVRFSPGETVKTVTVATVNGLAAEWVETFVVRLSNPDGVTIEDRDGTGTILDDDTGHTVTAAPVDVAETNSATTANVQFVLRPLSASPVTFDYRTLNGTAVAGTAVAGDTGDYAHTTGSVAFAPGSTTATVAIPVHGDTIDESDETFSLTITNMVGAGLTARPVVTIKDDDATGLTVGDVSVGEADGSAAVEVALTTPSAGTVTVDYTTADGTAKADADYVATSGTLTFSPGQTTKAVPVVIVQDDVYEPSAENFAVTLSNNVGAALADGSGVVSITDDDLLPLLSIPDVTVSEHEGAATFPLQLSHASSEQTRIEVYPFAATAAAGTDFDAAPKYVTIPAGARTATVAVPVVDGVTCEGTETFTVEVLATGALTGDAAAHATITDIDCGGLVVHDVHVHEDDAVATVRVSLEQARPVRVSASWATTALTATATDFTPSSGTVTFLPGSVTQTITVPVAGSAECEAPETFGITLTNAANAPLVRATATATIVDDDCNGVMLIGPPDRVPEGSLASFTAAIPAIRSTPTSVTITSADGTATAPADYSTRSIDIVIPRGARQAKFSVVTIGGSACEADETFRVTASAPSPGVDIVKPVAEAVIRDTSGVCISIAGAPPVHEGHTTSFTVTAFPAPEAPVSMTVKTGGGNTVPAGGGANADYHPRNDTITFAAGQSTREFPIATIDTGTGCEGPETFEATLSAGSAGVVFVDSNATATIIDFQGDCATSGFAIDNVTVLEPTKFARLTVTLSAAQAADATVNWATLDGSATVADGDYVAQSGSLSFAAGVTSVQFNVTFADVFGCEPNEVFMVRLSSPSGGIGLMDAFGTIVIDDVDC